MSVILSTEMAAYFDDIEVPKPVRDRVDRALAAVARVVDEPVRVCFISEYVNDDATRTFESLWLFTGTALLETDFRTDEDDFDYVVLTDNVTHWVAHRRSYDMGEATESSRLVVELALADDIEGTMKASGKNCVWLVQILRSHILPNMRRAGGSSGQK